MGPCYEPIVFFCFFFFFFFGGGGGGGGGGRNDGHGYGKLGSTLPLLAERKTLYKTNSKEVWNERMCLT